MPHQNPQLASLNKLCEAWKEVFGFHTDVQLCESPEPHVLIRMWSEPDDTGIRRPIKHVKLWDATTGKMTETMMCVYALLNAD